MIVTSIQCDRCEANLGRSDGLNVSPDKRIVFAVGCEFNGVETVTDYRTFDLCRDCLIVLANKLAKRLGVSERQDLAKWVHSLESGVTHDS